MNSYILYSKFWYLLLIIFNFNLKEIILNLFNRGDIFLDFYDFIT